MPIALKSGLVVTLFVSIVVPGARAERLNPEQVEALGSVQLPEREGPGKGGTYEYSDGGLAFVEDCLGKKDPSPNDGFPGCLMARGHRHTRSVVGVFDVPAPGGRARTVVPLWDLVGDYMIDQFAETYPIFDGKLERVFDILYDRPDLRAESGGFTFSTTAQACRTTPLSWAIRLVIRRIQIPKVAGRYPSKNKFGRNALHPNKSGRGIAFGFADLAERYFGGQRLLLASGKSRGSRESSAGPSFAIADLVTPKGAALEERQAARLLSTSPFRETRSLS